MRRELFVTSLVVGSVWSSSPSDHKSHSWYESPVVVGGTGGSGTRGVEETLIQLGIYMYPEKKSLIRHCYNGSPRDNQCMLPHGGALEQLPLYEWLMGESCQHQSFMKLRLSERGYDYVQSVPSAHRVPLRWGWKIPKTMYYINKLYKMFPGMLYIHVVRQPLDIAASYFEHLPDRVGEFVNLHGGFSRASRFFHHKCTTVTSFHSSKRDAVCNVDPSSLRAVRHLPHSKKPEIERVAPEVKPATWRCMDMMLWAQMNTALRHFGEQCLRPKQRYVYWHGEDNYALRGKQNQTQLIHHLAGCLHINHHKVLEVFLKSNTAHQSRRQLTFGKYKSMLSTSSPYRQCAEAAAPGSLKLFSYDDESV